MLVNNRDQLDRTISTLRAPHSNVSPSMGSFISNKPYMPFDVLLKVFVVKQTKSLSIITFFLFLCSKDINTSKLYNAG